MADQTEETVVKWYYPTGGLALLKEILFPSSVLLVTLVVAVALDPSKYYIRAPFTTLKKNPKKNQRLWKS